MQVHSLIVKTFLFQAIQFSQTVIIQAIQFNSWEDMRFHTFLKGITFKIHRLHLCRG